MKFIFLLLLPTISFAQFYFFEKGEQFTVKQSRWVRLSNESGERLSQSCQLLGISEIEVIKQFGENILFKVLANRGHKKPACKTGTLVHTNDVMADTLRTHSTIYWKRKNRMKKILAGDHIYTSLNGIHLGDKFQVNSWEWAVVEEDIIVDNEYFYETMVCRLLPRGTMHVLGFLANENKIILEYDIPSSRGYSECASGIIFTKSLNRF